MGRDVDVRDFRESRLSEARINDLRALAAETTERLERRHCLEITRFDATTGNAATARSLDSEPESGDLVLAAMRHVYTVAPAFGLSTAPEFTPDLAVQSTRGGGHVVHLHQRYKGLPVFEGELTVQFDPDRAIAQTVGSIVSVAGEGGGDCMPVRDAVLLAARHVRAPTPDEARAVDQFGQPIDAPSVDLSVYEARVLATFPGSPEAPTMLDAGPFLRPVTASLLWFPLGDVVHLAFDVSMQMPDGTTYRTLVSAAGGDILFSQAMVHGILGSANVYAVDGGSGRTVRSLPAAVADYGIPVPPALPQPFPREWLDAEQTAGAYVLAHVGADGAPVSGVPATDGTGGVLLEAADGVGEEQQVINLFYYCSFLHDVYYLLGFREADGNFQSDNGGRGGVGNDRVDARVRPHPIPLTARFITPPDGGPPVMEMGPVASSGRHCALDASVVFHEFTHGVSSRLIGGPLSTTALLSPQSAGIAEGLSDFAACALLDTTVVGSWVVGRPGGIRSNPYDDTFPDGFDKVGTGRYVRPHEIGEIWAATLMDVLRAIGKQLALQLVVDALKLTPANPSFLNMRDAVLAAAGPLATAVGTDAAQLTTTLWAVFARHGLGPAATSNGAQLTGITGDFSAPAAPDAAAPDAAASDAVAAPAAVALA